MLALANALTKQYDSPLPSQAYVCGIACMRMRSGQLLKQGELSGRMSREGNCWGNVFVKAILFEPEDVASLAKNYVNHIEAMSDVFDHIIGFHNSMQLHSKRGNL